MLSKGVLGGCTFLFASAKATLENLKITPHTLLESVFTANPEPMILKSPIWDTFQEIPCQYYYKQGFYSLIQTTAV